MRKRTIIIIIAVVAVVAGAVWFFVPSVALETGIVGHWDFNEGSGSILGDSSGYDNDGMVYGATWVDGIEGTALYLDGINDYIDVGNDDSLNPSDAITVAAWFKPESYTGSGNDPLVTKGYTLHVDPYYQYHLGVNGDLRTAGERPGSFLFDVSVSGTIYEVQTPIDTWTAGNWYHIVGTFDGFTLAIYVNGNLEDSETIAILSMMNYGEDVYFGRFNNLIGQDIDGYLPGTIDEIIIYDRALNAQEVKSLYLLD